jgi:hypothetical protein
MKSFLYSTLKHLYNSFVYLICPTFYIFFEEYSMPFPGFSLNMDRTLVATPTIVFNVNESVFFPYLPDKSFAEICIYNKPHKFPILSMEVVDGEGRCLRDLTDFVESLRYIHIADMESPSVSNIISIWCIIHAIPLNREMLFVRYITINGDEMTVSPIDVTPIEDEPHDPVNHLPPLTNSDE